MMKDIDKLSIKNAYRFFESNDIEKMEIGTKGGLQQLHQYLFDGYEKEDDSSND